jgi:hypothetical protein
VGGPPGDTQLKQQRRNMDIQQIMLFITAAFIIGIVYGMIDQAGIDKRVKEHRAKQRQTLAKTTNREEGNNA